MKRTRRARNETPEPHFLPASAARLSVRVRRWPGLDERQDGRSTAVGSWLGLLCPSDRNARRCSAVRDSVLLPPRLPSVNQVNRRIAEISPRGAADRLYGRPTPSSDEILERNHKGSRNPRSSLTPRPPQCRHGEHDRIHPLEVPQLREVEADRRRLVELTRLDGIAEPHKAALDGGPGVRRGE